MQACQRNFQQSNSIHDDLPPHDVEAEAGVIGCIFCADPVSAHNWFNELSIDHFYAEPNREIYRALKSLDAAGKPLTEVDVTIWLRDKGRLKDFDGSDYISSLAKDIPGPSMWSSYFESVDAYRERRGTVYGATELGLIARDTRIDIHQVRDAARRFFGEACSNDSGNGERLLEAREFNELSEPPPIVPVYTLGKVDICTEGNLSTITSAIKTGKSGTVHAMLASVIGTEGRDYLGFGSSNGKGHALLHFDTEQPHADHWHSIGRVLQRAGISEKPNWFHSYWLTGLAPGQVLQCIQDAVRLSAKEHGGLHSILVDGVADLVGDVNDAAECNGLVAQLHDLAIKFLCSVVLVIHFNPGGDKTRGHLGSQLERKAETNLRLDKDDNGVTTIWSAKQRRAPILRGTGPRFCWSVGAGMHMSIESAAVTKKQAKEKATRESLTRVMEDVFLGHASMRWTDMQLTLKNSLGVSENTAERRINEALALGVIKKAVAGLYVLRT
jgi:hypothetical protein